MLPIVSCGFNNHMRELQIEFPKNMKHPASIEFNTIILDTWHA